jgi:hypothetical protein
MPLTNCQPLLPSGQRIGLRGRQGGPKDAEIPANVLDDLRGLCRGPRLPMRGAGVVDPLSERPAGLQLLLGLGDRSRQLGALSTQVIEQCRVGGDRRREFAQLAVE